MVRERAEVNGKWIRVYQDSWRPEVSVKKNPRTGREFVVAEPQIIQFSIECFKYPDGRDGYTILGIEPAQNIQQQDSDSLFIVREEWEMQKSAERRERMTQRESERN